VSCDRTHALALLSPFAEIRVPATIWLDADAEPIPAAHAAEALAAHEARLGLSFEIMADGLALLALRPAASILWSMFKRSHAVTRFRKPRGLALNDAPAVVLGTDHKGGFLLWLIEVTESEDAMNDNSTDRAIDLLQVEAEKITTERGGSAAGHYQQHYEEFVKGQADLNVSAVGRSHEEKEALHTEHDARKHDYAAFLAERLGEYHQRVGNPERAADMAEVQHNHASSAETLRADIVASQSPAGTEKDRFRVLDPNEGTPSGSLTAREAVLAVAEEGNYSIIHTDGKPDSDYPQAGTDRLMIQAEDGDFIDSANTYRELAGNLVERGNLAIAQAPERGPDDDPDKPKGKGPAPDFAETAFVLLERGANGARDTTMSAHLFTDRAQAVEAAHGFPSSQEDAGRQGLTTWAEVHPVTPQFATNFAEMDRAGRLETMAMLYSSAREIDGQLIPADPREAGAIKGQLQENAGDASPYYEPTRPQHIRATLAAEPAPDGTQWTRSTYLDPNDNPALRSDDAPKETGGPVPAGPPPEEREPNRYAVLKAETLEDREQMTENLVVVAESRDFDGGEPAAREIVARDNAESAKRQTAELAAAHEGKADRPMTADEIDASDMAEIKAEITKREARDGAEPTKDRGDGRGAGGRGMM
jgi:hypothetical protein